MKILFSVCCTLALIAGIPALGQENQFPPSNSKERSPKLEGLYLSLGAGGTFIPGSGFPVSSRLTGFLANGWGPAIGIRGGNMTNLNAPPFPHHAVVKGFAIFGIKDGFSVVDLCAVRKSWLRGSRQQLRLGLEAGPALVATQIHTYTLQTQYYNDPIPTFLAEPVSKRTPSLQLALNTSYVPSRPLGLELCLWGNLNAVQPLLGFEASLLLGRVRAKNKEF